MPLTKFTRGEAIALSAVIAPLAAMAGVAELDVNGDVIAFAVYELLSYVALRILVREVTEWMAENR